MSYCSAEQNSSFTAPCGGAAFMRAFSLLIIVSAVIVAGLIFVAPVCIAVARLILAVSVLVLLQRLLISPAHSRTEAIKH